MDGTPAGYEIRGSNQVEGMTMDGSLLDAINALPEKSKGGSKSVWTEEMDKALLAGWTAKDQRLVAKVLGLSPNTCRDRYRRLTRV